MADRPDRPTTEALRGLARTRRSRRRALLLVLGLGVADSAISLLLNSLSDQHTVVFAAVAPALLVEVSAVLILRPALRRQGWLPSPTRELTPGQPVMLSAHLRSDGERNSAPAVYRGGRLVIELGAAEPLVWQRRRFPYRFDAGTPVPLRPPYRVLGAGPATGAGAARVDGLVYRQLDLQAGELSLALAVPEEALRFVRTALATVGADAGAATVPSRRPA